MDRQRNFIHFAPPRYAFGTSELALPPYGNEVVGMLKTTALASTVTMAEVTGVAETIVAETFAPYEVFLSAAVIYLILVWIFERGLAAVERALETP